MCDRDLDAKPYCDRSCNVSGRRRKRSTTQAKNVVHKEVHSGELRVQVRVISVRIHFFRDDVNKVIFLGQYFKLMLIGLLHCHSTKKPLSSPVR